MGEISPSYRDKLVSHFVKDESSRRGDKAGYHNVRATCSNQKTNKFLVGDCNGEHYPCDDDRKDFSGAELRRQRVTTGREELWISIFYFASAQRALALRDQFSISLRERVATT